MRCLLDTQTFLWLAAGDERLGSRCVQAYLDTQNDSFLSIASVWEMAIKLSVGRLTLGRPLRQLVETARKGQGIRLLPIELEHALHVAQLPFHHRDPFDRLIVAQALVEGMTILSRDESLDRYGVQRVW